LLINNKRRSIPDFIAGSVIIRLNPQELPLAEDFDTDYHGEPDPRAFPDAEVEPQLD